MKYIVSTYGERIETTTLENAENYYWDFVADNGYARIEQGCEIIAEWGC